MGATKTYRGRTSMSSHTQEELRCIPKHPILKRAKKVLDSLEGQDLAFPIILEIKDLWLALQKKLEYLGY